MPGNPVNLQDEERAVCRLRYKVVANYIDPGPPVKGPNKICKAIAKWGGKDGAEASPLLPEFGNPRTVNRTWNNSKSTDELDLEMARTWVDKQSSLDRAEILELLGMEEWVETKPDVKLTIKNEDAKPSLKTENIESKVQAGTSASATKSGSPTSRGVKREHSDVVEDARPSSSKKTRSSPRKQAKKEEKD